MQHEVFIQFESGERCVKEKLPGIVGESDDGQRTQRELAEDSRQIEDGIVHFAPIVIVAFIVPVRVCSLQDGSRMRNKRISIEDAMQFVESKRYTD